MNQSMLFERPGDCRLRLEIVMSLTMFRQLLYLAAAALVLIGCDRSSSGPQVVEVTGVVTLNGAAVEGANVVFSPAGDGDPMLASQAVTNSNGQFSLSTHVGGGNFKSGIAPGKYSVAVTKLDTAAIKSTLAPPKNLLPAKYASPKSSGLNLEVVAGQENDFKVALEGK
jgi:hypothetical protein